MVESTAMRLRAPSDPLLGRKERGKLISGAASKTLHRACSHVCLELGPAGVGSYTVLECLHVIYYCTVMVYRCFTGLAEELYGFRSSHGHELHSLRRRKRIFFRGKGPPATPRSGSGTSRGVVKRPSTKRMPRLPSRWAVEPRIEEV